MGEKSKKEGWVKSVWGNQGWELCKGRKSERWVKDGGEVCRGREGEKSVKPVRVRRERGEQSIDTAAESQLFFAVFFWVFV